MAVPKPTPGKLEAWPLANLHRRLKDCNGAKPQCVLLTTGAMNPPHRGHAQLLHQARLRLEKEGYDVLAGWLSPSQDGYVGPKAARLGTVHISGDLRLHMAQGIRKQDPANDVLLYVCSRYRVASDRCLVSVCVGHGPRGSICLGLGP